MGKLELPSRGEHLGPLRPVHDGEWHVAAALGEEDVTPREPGKHRAQQPVRRTRPGVDASPAALVPGRDRPEVALELGVEAREVVTEHRLGDGQRPRSPGPRNPGLIARPAAESVASPDVSLDPGRDASPALSSALYPALRRTLSPAHQALTSEASAKSSRSGARTTGIRVSGSVIRSRLSARSRMRLVRSRPGEES
ncbi:hypothetical protein PSCLAVI8L_410005 [Pseudoclavibacter sp. 8L]|nr:hypothetical protein PSCLAVI8L_410005 [Pseudoclavibacter sp. 8L]